MMTRLLALDVANASVYDGGSGLGEAILMALRANKKGEGRRILVAGSLHPLMRRAAYNVARLQGVEFVTVPVVEGRLDMAALTELPPAVSLVIQQPNFFGGLEAVDQLTDWAHAAGMSVIAVVNPLAMAVLKPPGQWGETGADIVCGEGQPLGVPLSNGGPYFGFMCCRMEHVRQMPGRIVGRTVDLEGKPGFTLTLQAREQHIRRSKATSNICTNQGLLVTAATIYMSLVGPEGLARVASSAHANTNTLKPLLAAIPGVTVAFGGPSFHEFVVRLPKPASTVLAALAARGIAGGYDLNPHHAALGDAMLVCATETKTDADLRAYADALRAVLK